MLDSDVFGLDEQTAKEKFPELFDHTAPKTTVSVTTGDCGVALKRLAAVLHATELSKKEGAVGSTAPAPKPPVPIVKLPVDNRKFLGSDNHKLRAPDISKMRVPIVFGPGAVIPKVAATPPDATGLRKADDASARSTAAVAQAGLSQLVAANKHSPGGPPSSDLTCSKFCPGESAPVPHPGFLESFKANQFVASQTRTPRKTSIAMS